MIAPPATRVRFVGRRPELAELSARLRDAAGGRGAVVVLRGEAGMGKSRLAEELAGLATAEGIPVSWGRCPADPGAPPLWPVHRVLAGLPGGGSALIDVPLDPQVSAEEATAARFLRSVAASDALVRAARPSGLLVVIEDLHWADSATMATLAHLAGDVPGSHLLVLATARTDPQDAAVPGLSARPGVVVLHLDGLTVAEIGEYLTALAGPEVDPRYAELVLRQTAGRCLFVQVVSRLLVHRLDLGHYDDAAARATLAGRPELGELAAEPLLRVSGGCRSVVEAAAVLGEEFTTAPLALACGQPTESVQAGLDEAAAVGLLRPGGVAGTGRFVHALVRDGVYAGLGADRRRQLHTRLAAALATATPDAARTSELARHLSAAADGPSAHRSAARAQRRAGDSLLAHQAPVEAAQAYRIALAHLDAAGDASAPEVAELLLDQAGARFRGGAFGAALADCRRATELAGADRWDLVARAALVVDGVRVEDGPGLAALVAGALDLVPAHAHAERAQLLARTAYLAADSGDLTRAEVRSAEALALAEKIGEPSALIAALRARHLARAGPRHTAERLALGGHMIALGEPARPIATLWGRLWRVDAFFELGDLPGVDAELVEISGLARQLGWPLARWHLARLRAAREAILGAFAEGLEHARTGARIASDMEDPSLTKLSLAYRHYVAHVRGTLAEPDGGVLPIHEVIGWLRGAPAPMPIMQATLLLSHLLAEERDAAAALLARLIEALPGWVYDGRWLVTVAMLADGAAELADAGAAELLYPRLLPFAHLTVSGGSGVVACAGSVSRCLGRLALLTGRLPAAQTHLEAANAAERRMGARPFVALTRLHTAQLSVAQGRLRAALETAVAAASELARLDMPGPAAVAAELVAVLRATPDRRGLTAREAEVAALVAGGLTNLQIAGRLFLSERTVESHVSHVLAKISGTSRVDIVTWWAAGTG